MNPLPRIYPFSRNSNDGTSFKTVNAALLALVAAVALAASPAQAANLLVNPSFENNSGHNIPIGWTRFAPADGPGLLAIIGSRAMSPAQSGALHFKEWGACL